MKLATVAFLVSVASSASALRLPAKARQLPSQLKAASISALAFAPLPALAEPGDFWDRLANEPPITLNPFSINPAGYAFGALYACYLGWQVWGPTSEAEQAWGAKVKEEAAAAAAAAPGFLEESASAEGAQMLPSGLVFQELTAGDGEFPTAESMVKVHYHGTLHDGVVFDSSIDRGQPAEFKLGQVIKGWQEGVSKMRPGGKAVLTVPPALAYGDMPLGKIPGGSALKFEVELLEVNEAEKGFFDRFTS